MRPRHYTADNGVPPERARGAANGFNEAAAFTADNSVSNGAAFNDLSELQ